MFVFHYASTTNPFCWKSSLIPCNSPCVIHGSQSLLLRLYPVEVKGDWVTLVWAARSCGGRRHHVTGGRHSLKYSPACVRGSTICLQQQDTHKCTYMWYKCYTNWYTQKLHKNAQKLSPLNTTSHFLKFCLGKNIHKFDQKRESLTCRNWDIEIGI